MAQPKLKTNAKTRAKSAKTTKQQKKDCDCIFCKLKCPDCGSKSITGDYKVNFNFSEPGDDSFNISVGDNELTLFCNGCGNQFEYSDFDQEEELWPIVRNLNSVLGLDISGLTVTRKNNQLQVSRYKYEIAESKP
jgi:hypothetical protein